MTMAEMTEPTSLPLATTPAGPRRTGLRLALVALALVELTDGVAIQILLQGDMSGLGAIVKLNMVAQPVLALAALIFALTGRLGHAIPALGAIVLLAWLKFMALIPDGFDYGNLYVNLDNATQAFIFPLLGVCATALAARGERLGIATVLVGIPTVVNLFNALSFLIGVTIYGF
jgi:hypothetical protein